MHICKYMCELLISFYIHAVIACAHVSMYTCMYGCILHINMYVYVYMHVHMYCVHIYIYTQLCIHICTWKWQIQEKISRIYFVSFIHLFSICFGFLMHSSDGTEFQGTKWPINAWSWFQVTYTITEATIGSCSNLWKLLSGKAEGTRRALNHWRGHRKLPWGSAIHWDLQGWIVLG